MNERPDRLEEVVRSALLAAASSVRTEPDNGRLAARIDEQRRRKAVRTRHSLAAAAVVLGAVAGGSLGSLLVHEPVDRTVLSVRSGNQAGPLPSGPPRSLSGGSFFPGLARHLLSPAAAYGPPPSLTRATGSGVILGLTSSYLAPIDVSAGRVSGCYGALLLSTSARLGDVGTGGEGTVRMEPLSPGGLEVVDSGVVPVGDGSDLWWATVSVGAAVERVAAEPADGVKDAMRPVDGVAVLGGLAPAAEATRFFSVVAEDARGRPLASLGFLAGYGSSVRTAAGGIAMAASGCAGFARLRGAAPRAPLLAAAGVVAAFEQAYGARVEDERLAAVAGIPETSESRVAREPSATPSVRVGAVEFLSPTTAVVTYRLSGGSWRTGAAVFTPIAGWRVAASTYCSDGASRLGQGAGACPALARG